MLWEELTAKGLDSAIKKSEGVCVLPIGVLEKHGDHLPLGTDMYIATETAKAAVAKSPAVIFPYYFLGQILEARHVTGTIAASHKLIIDALLEMCDEIHRNGFSKILIVSSHGGNVHLLRYFAQLFPGLNRPYSVYTSFLHDLTQAQFKKIRTECNIDDVGGHAGFYETALMMFIRPDLVNMDKVIVKESESLNRIPQVNDERIYTGFHWYADYPHHFAGDPTGATVEYGKKLFDILQQRIVKMIKTVKADTMTPSLINEYNSRTSNPRG